MARLTIDSVPDRNLPPTISCSVRGRHGSRISHSRRHALLRNPSLRASRLRISSYIPTHVQRRGNEWKQVDGFLSFDATRLISLLHRSTLDAYRLLRRTYR